MGKTSCSSRATSKTSPSAKKHVRGSPAQANDGRRSLTSEETYKLLEQHCRGMWSDSDDEEEEKKAGKETEHNSEERQPNSETTSPSECLKNDEARASTPSLPASSKTAKTAKNKRRDISRTIEGSCAAADSGSAGSVVVAEEEGLDVVGRTEHSGGGALVADAACGQEENQKRKMPSKRQAKGLRRWTATRSRTSSIPSKSHPSVSDERNEPSASNPLSPACSASHSLKFLKEFSGLSPSSLASQDRSTDVSLKTAQQGKTNEKKTDRSNEDNGQKLFDETVREIRNLASTKTQKMPLPELLARKKAEAAAVKARQAEEKLLETTRRAEALMAEDAEEETLRQIEIDLKNLSEKFRALNNSGEISEAVSAQQQRSIRRVTEALALHLQRLSRPSSFSFKRAAAPLSSNVSLTQSADVNNNAKTSGNDFNAAEGEGDKLAESPPSNVLSISSLKNAVLLVGPGAAQGREIWLRDLDECTVFVVDRVPCARLHEIKNSAIMLLQVSSAAWVQNCTKCLFSINAQQLRVHDSLDVSFFLNTASSPIIERTSGAVFAASVSFLKGEETEGQSDQLVRSDAWRDVKDFDWIRRQQSPNWRVLAGPSPEARPLLCVQREEACEAQQKKDISVDFKDCFNALFTEGDVSVVASACWRLIGVPLGFSAVALKQHSTAAAAADAVAALSSKDTQT
ncbi:hypothetical protein Emed_007260 [Eimeria media]